MSRRNEILLDEFEAVANYIKERHSVNIKQKELLIEYTEITLLFVQSLKIWKEKLESHSKDANLDMYFQEIVSNIIHILILGNIDMQIPTLTMLRRTQELILTYIYYSEHPVELYLKEVDENIRNLKGFSELKDYVKKYPLSMKYNVDDQKMQVFLSKIIEDWTIQYKELSNYVHGTNSKFLKNISFIDEFEFVRSDIKFLIKQVTQLSSLVNALLIIFNFNEYIEFNGNEEKFIIRNSISDKCNYKVEIVKYLKEI